MKWIIAAAALYYLYQNRSGKAGKVAGLSLEALASAIQFAEGWFPGSLSQQNNNPGNLRYVGQTSALGSDDNGFAIFPTYATGFQALINQLQLDQSRNPTWTLEQFVNSYAPPSDNNDDSTYLSNILNAMQESGANADSSTELGEFS